MHQRVAHRQNGRQSGEVEQDDGAARVVARGLDQESEHQQAQQGDVPQRRRAADVRLERQVVREFVVAVHDARQHEDGRRRQADFGEVRE